MCCLFITSLCSSGIPGSSLQHLPHTPHHLTHTVGRTASCLSSSSGVAELLLIPSVSFPLYCLVSDGIKSKLDFMLIGIRITRLYRLYLKVYLSSNIEPKHSMVNGNCVKRCPWGFPGGAVVENLPANAGDTGSSPGLGRSHMPRGN